MPPQPSRRPSTRDYSERPRHESFRYETRGSSRAYDDYHDKSHGREYKGSSAYNDQETPSRGTREHARKQPTRENPQVYSNRESSRRPSVDRGPSRRYTYQDGNDSNVRTEYTSQRYTAASSSTRADPLPGGPLDL